MKRFFLLLISTSLLLVSCSEKEAILDKEDNKTISGVFTYDQPQIIDFEGKTITLISEDMEESEQFNMPQTKGESSIQYFTNINGYKLSSTEKLILTNSSGFAPGLYFCDVWYYGGKIVLPQNAYAGTILMPNPAAYNNWKKQTKGINWSMSTTSQGITLSFGFYTLLVRYDAIGRTYNHTIPMNGGNVKVPWRYFYP